MDIVNQKIIQAVIDKANKVCPDSLAENIETFNKYLQKYEQAYTRAGISVKRFADVDEFVESYPGQ